MQCYFLVEGDDGRTPGYYDSASESSGPPLEAVVTIPIHPGTGASGKARQKASGYQLRHSFCFFVMQNTFNLKLY